MITYVWGFVCAVILTFIAYFSVVEHWFTGAVLVGVIMALAAIQVVVQLIFFLHLGREKGPRWKSATLYFMLLVLVIIVGGSLWIMSGLDYNMMMTPEQMNEHMLKESNKGF